MKQMIITPRQFKKYMKEEDYSAFIDEIAGELKITLDEEPIWIVAQVLEKKDKL